VAEVADEQPHEARRASHRHQADALTREDLQRARLPDPAEPVVDEHLPKSELPELPSTYGRDPAGTRLTATIHDSEPVIATAPPTTACPRRRPIAPGPATR